MRPRLIYVAVLALMTLGRPDEVAAQELVRQSFDEVFEGDDPGMLYRYSLSFDPALSTEIHFDGTFINLASEETGVRFALAWRRPDGTGGNSPEEGFVPLPAAGQLPVKFEEMIDFTPAELTLHIEGGGPADHFRFVGDVTATQVPEAGVAWSFALCVLISLGRRRFRRCRTLQPRFSFRPKSGDLAHHPPHSNDHLNYAVV
jgi:hypothetical protein